MRTWSIICFVLYSKSFHAGMISDYMLILDLFFDVWCSWPHNTNEMIRRVVKVYSNEMDRLNKLIAFSDKRYQELKDDLEDLQVKYTYLVARSLKFKMKCDFFESDKAPLMAESARKGVDIKKLRKEIESAISTYQESEDLTKAKV